MPALTASAVGTAGDTTSVASSLPSSNYGDQVSFTATVTPTSAGSTPGGNVTFSGSRTNSSGVVSGFNITCIESGLNHVPVSGGSATCTPASALPGGSDTITASYGGDPTYAPSSGNTVQTVAPLATTTGIANTGINPTTYGQPATFTATITAVPSNDGRAQATTAPPGGNANFYKRSISSTNKLPDCTTVPVSTTGGTTTSTCNTRDLDLGSNNVFAQYNGDSNYTRSSTGNTSVSQTVNQGSSSTSVSPLTSQSAPGQQVTITATVTPTNLGLAGPTGTVTFAAGGSNLPDCTGIVVVASAGSPPAYTATCNTVDLPTSAGETVTATYSGDANYSGSAGSSTPNGYVVQAGITPTTTTPPTTTPPKQQGGGSQVASPGYWMVGSDGGIFSFGPGADFYGSMGATHLNAPIVGMARDNTTGGYWMVASDGGVFSFNAPFHGSMGGKHLNAPIVGMAATPSGDGYYLVASDGGIFTFGGAHFFGSTGGMHLNKPIVGMAVAPGNQGYWLVASDGGIFTFGSATFFGSTGAIHLNRPIVGMAAEATGNGYWLVASDGGIFTFGTAHYYGSTGAIHLNKPIVGMAAIPGGGGYRLVATDGGIFTFGPNATFYGSMGATHLNAPIVSMVTAG
jgi:hypothetical protein